MDRRSVLRMLAVSGGPLSSLTRKALGADAAADASLPGASAEAAQSLGLPSDWRFIVPSQWETVDRNLQARLNSPLRDASPIDLGGIELARSSGKIEIGKLDPVGVSVELPPELAAIVPPADAALSLEVLTRDFNPFLADPRGPGGTPLIGPFTAGGELYQGKTLLPVRFI